MSYRDLKSFQSSEIIYDFTAEFCHLYIDYKSRTKDQMEQAARSGMQNIAEPSKNPTSKKSELKLLGVARGSMEELLNDYLAYLRQNNLPLWDRDSPQSRAVRNLVYQSDWSYHSYKTYLSNPADAANAMICLINQANFLLDRQIKTLKEDFIKHGGFTENLRYEREEEIKHKVLGNEGDDWLIKAIWESGSVRLENGKVIKKEELKEGQKLDPEFERVVKGLEGRKGR